MGHSKSNRVFNQYLPYRLISIKLQNEQRHWPEGFGGLNASELYRLDSFPPLHTQSKMLLRSIASVLAAKFCWVKHCCSLLLGAKVGREGGGGGGVRGERGRVDRGDREGAKVGWLMLFYDTWSQLIYAVPCIMGRGEGIVKYKGYKRRV